MSDDEKPVVVDKPPPPCPDCPPCPNCGDITIRNGGCHVCMTCGTSTGCG